MSQTYNPEELRQAEEHLRVIGLAIANTRKSLEAAESSKPKNSNFLGVSSYGLVSKLKGVLSELHTQKLQAEGYLNRLPKFPPLEKKVPKLQRISRNRDGF